MDFVSRSFSPSGFRRRFPAEVEKSHKELRIFLPENMLLYTIRPTPSIGCKTHIFVYAMHILGLRVCKSSALTYQSASVSDRLYKSAAFCASFFVDFYNRQCYNLVQKGSHWQNSPASYQTLSALADQHTERRAVYGQGTGIPYLWLRESKERGIYLCQKPKRNSVPSDCRTLLKR